MSDVLRGFIALLLFLPGAIPQAVAAEHAVGATNQPPQEKHWSLQPLRRPTPPAVSRREWIRTPIDAFVMAQLEQRQMAPNPAADRRTLLRRLNYDLIGLPPTPEEMRQFLADRSANAFDKVVDRLLASPRYGERWARHWMDAVHFAETHGHDQDRIRTNAWPYRDYLVQAFNQDKSYRRFVQEQLAGDVLFPTDPQATVGLGFVAAGPWDESSLRDIREDTLDRQIARYLDRDDMVATTMSTFVSATVHCARCHDHKFDPISQEDYYSLQAVFAGLDRADRVFDLDPGVHATRQALLKRKRNLEQREPALLASLLSPAVQAEIQETLATLSRDSVVWSVLEPVSVVSSNGTTLTRQSDGSLLATGTRPDQDTYVVTAPTDLTGITAVRLEVLTDESLPQRGPGRQDNGNLHLSEFSVQVTPKHGPATNAPSMPVGLQNPSADFNQEGWTIEHAIDGKPKTAWGIHPRVGTNHVAVFELKEDTGFRSGTLFTFVLEQKHGTSHLIGRLRLAVTASPRPVRIRSIPEPMLTALQLPASQRTEEQQKELTIYCLKERVARQLTALGRGRLVYAGASDFVPDGGLVPPKGPRTVQVLKRGDITKPGAEAKPGALSAVRALPSRFALANPMEEGSRRAALAGWICDGRNPLTWRSIVNRVWHHHFGAGLVETPNDFGNMGAAPSHPELLDWLASWFLDQGGSFKQLHRLIVSSAVYQQTSANQPAMAQRDSDNRYLWRMNRQRLDAESLRDSLLQIAGQLDLSMGGPSDQQFALSPGIHVTPVVDYGQFNIDSSAGRRRSIYRFLFRTLPDPFMDSLDCPEGSQLAPARGVSVSALQALSMLNNQLVIRQSQHLADHLALIHSRLPDQIQAACELILGRRPTGTEAGEFLDYTQRHGLANLCRLLFNSNEFIFLN